MGDSAALDINVKFTPIPQKGSNIPDESVWEKDSYNALGPNESFEIETKDFKAYRYDWLLIDIEYADLHKRSFHPKSQPVSIKKFREK